MNELYLPATIWVILRSIILGKKNQLPKDYMQVYIPFLVLNTRKLNNIVFKCTYKSDTIIKKK